MAAVRVPARRLLVETDAPYLSPQPVRGQPNQPAHVVHTAQALARRAAGGLRASSRRRSSAAPPTCSDGEHAGAALGQNFLVDRNILDVIERLAERRAERRGARDRRRPGGARPSGSRRARRHVHVVEIDERLRAAAAEALAQVATTSRCTSPTRWSSISRALDAGAGEGRRQPPLRDRRDRDPADDRGAADGRAAGW